MIHVVIADDRTLFRDGLCGEIVDAPAVIDAAGDAFAIDLEVPG
jgi:hypothetical protein